MPLSFTDVFNQLRFLITTSVTLRAADRRGVRSVRLESMVRKTVFIFNQAGMLNGEQIIESGETVVCRKN